MTGASAKYRQRSNPRAVQSAMLSTKQFVSSAGRESVERGEIQEQRGTSSVEHRAPRPVRARSEEHGDIRVQRGALSVERGDIRVQHRALGVEHGAIHV